MELLKLVALDEEDLQVISAHAQDAVMKVGDIRYAPSHKQLVMAVNRFAWETRPGLFRRRNERRRSVLHFGRVLSMKSAGFAPGDEEQVLSLLALRFAPAAAPAGTVEIVFSGATAIRLDVECIEARLTDLGPAWDTPSRPAHRT